MRIAWVVFLLFLASPARGQPEATTAELLLLINERDKAYNQRFDAQEKAVAAALAAAKEAVTKAESAAEKRFDSVNEFRNTLKDQQINLMPRSETIALLKALDEKTQSNDVRITQLISRSEGANWLWGVITGVGGLMAGVALAIVSLRKSAMSK